jgi:hypothetical protein
MISASEPAAIGPGSHMSTFRHLAASFLLALVLAPPTHAADELFLRWDHCFGDGGTYNKTFACDTNSGTDVLVGSFRLDHAVDGVHAIDGVMDVMSLPGQVLPSWWQFVRTGTCRRSSLDVSLVLPPASSACIDPWSDYGPAGGFDYTLLPPVSPGYSGRMKFVFGLPTGASFTIPAGQEIIAFRARIDHALTVGPASCGGCGAPMCIAFVNAFVALPNSGGVDIFGHNQPNHDWNVTWQDGGVTTVDPFDGFVSCQSVTPVRASTWGSIKSIYRR